MLAPNSERLQPGPYLDLCLASLKYYPEFVEGLEARGYECDFRSKVRGEVGNHYVNQGIQF